MLNAEPVAKRAAMHAQPPPLPHPAQAPSHGTPLDEAARATVARQAAAQKNAQAQPSATAAGCLGTAVVLVVVIGFVVWLFTARDGWVRIDLKDGGWFAYRHVGFSPGGTHVLHTHSSGGGTGIFEDLLLVRFHWDHVRHNGQLRDRLLMNSVGGFTLGDRDDGEIRFEGNRIVAGRSRYREQDTIIPLDEESD